MNLRRVLAAVLAGWAGTWTPLQADDTAAVLALHRAYVGWDVDDATVLSRITRTVFRPRESPATAAVEFRRGALYRTVLTSAGGTTEGSGFDGYEYWVTNLNGNVLAGGAAARRLAVTENVVASEAISHVRASLRANVVIGGRAATVVRITPHDGVAADLAIDGATGAIVRITEELGDGRGEQLAIDRYDEFAPGKRYVAAAHDTVTGMTLTAQTRLAPSLVAADVRIPPPSARWTFGAGRTTPISIVTEHETGHAVHVRATIDGHAGTFLLDSGGTGILIFAPFAARAGLHALGETTFSGLNGNTVRAHDARVGEIGVADAVLHDTIVTIAPATMGRIDGILGFDFLAQAVVDVDLERRSLSVHDPHAHAALAPGAYAFAVDLASGQPRVAISLGTGVEVYPIFDTASSFFAVLGADVLRGSRVAQRPFAQSFQGPTIEDQRFITGIDGSEVKSLSCRRLASIAIGPFRYANQEACFVPARVFGSDGGLIGYDFLRHYNWTFDYPESLIVLTPNGT